MFFGILGAGVCNEVSSFFTLKEPILHIYDPVDLGINFVSRELEMGVL